MATDHHHTHEIVHPTLERHHETTEVRQVVQPIVEKVREVKVEDKGQSIRVIEKHEDDSRVKEKLRDIKAEISSHAGVTESSERTKEIKDTKYSQKKNEDNKTM